MLCELLINSIKSHPSFDPKQLLPVLEAQVKTWPLHSAQERPDFHCLSEAWTFGELQVALGMAEPDHVAEVLAYLIVRGDIDPFVDVQPAMVDSHLLTSRTEVSRRLCQRLRPKQKVIADHGRSLPLFVRAIALGFNWGDLVLVEHGLLKDIAADSSKSRPEDLLAGFQLAAAMSADRDGAGIPDEQDGSVRNLRMICDGVYQCLRIGGSERSVAAKSVVSIIELERVIEGMVELLTSQGGVSAERSSAIANDWFKVNVPHGPLSHLRSYVAVGQPLMNLVGSMNDTEVRRGIERLMDRVTPDALPGFPTISSTSRRPSDLLRRLRYLVRCMVLRAAAPGASQIFLDFRRDLFYGAESNPELAAARIAFTRPQHQPGAQGAQLGVRAGLSNLVQQTGLADAADASNHPCMAALRCAVLVDIDTWSVANDGDTTDVPDAVLQILRQLALSRALAADTLVTHLFDLSVCARAREADERLQGQRRHDLFGGIDKLHRAAHGNHEETLRNAITSGLPAFRKLIEDNFHREFDREALNGIAGLGLFAEVDRTVGESDRAGNGRRCQDWLRAWGFLSAPAPFVSAVQSLPDSELRDLVAEVKGAPYASDPYSGGSRLFAYADAAAAGHETARQALLQLAGDREAANFFRVLDRDAVGRSIGMALSQVCSSELMDQLFGAQASFPLALDGSVDGVTPVMAAIRFANNDDNSRKQGLDAVRRCDGHAGGPDHRRDRRGWRAIHHAFAVGHVDAAKRLLDSDPSCIEVKDHDGTTFLIEAFCCKPGVADPAVVIEFALSLLRKMSPEARLRVFGFRGPKGLDGNPRSLVSAALADSSRWTQFIAMTREFADTQYASAIWNEIGAVTLSKLLESQDFIRFAEYCEHVVAVGGKAALSAFAAGLSGEPVPVRVALMVSDSREAVAAQAKCWELRRHGAFDVGASSPFDGGNMLHALVKAAANARRRFEGLGERSGMRVGFEAKHGDNPDYRRDLFSFAMQALSGSADAARAVQARDFDHESSVWKASRVGIPVLALAYARFLGAPAGVDDPRWLLAARFIKDVNRYQDGVREDCRIFVDSDRHLCLGIGGGESIRLSSKPLPRELSTRNAREWLQRNASAIASSLKAYIGTDLDVGAYAFVNWLAHLASDSTQA